MESPPTFTPGQLWRNGPTHRLRVTAVDGDYVSGDTSEDGGETFTGAITFKASECIFSRYAELVEVAPAADDLPGNEHANGKNET